MSKEVKNAILVSFYSHPAVLVESRDAVRYPKVQDPDLQSVSLSPYFYPMTGWSFCYKSGEKIRLFFNLDNIRSQDAFVARDRIALTSPKGVKSMAFIKEGKVSDFLEFYSDGQLHAVFTDNCVRVRGYARYKRSQWFMTSHKNIAPALRRAQALAKKLDAYEEIRTVCQRKRDVCPVCGRSRVKD